MTTAERPRCVCPDCTCLEYMTNPGMVCVYCKRDQHWDCHEDAGHDMVPVESRGWVCSKCGFKATGD